ncbi:MAG: acyltransferase family protein [Pseudomonadota bacterium]
MSSQLSGLKYRADIDGLRAIAVLFVVGYHAFPGKIVGGFIGVDIFFVISGFLISSLLFESFRNGSFSLNEFYSRRIKRIFPSLVVVLFTCLVAGWFVLLSDEFEQLGKHLWGGATFISNWMLFLESGYFDKAAETKPLLHLWSLAIEEQFYIVWPVLLWFAFKKNWKVLAVIIALCTGSFFLNYYLTTQNVAAAFFSPFARFWELLSGAWLAWRVRTFPDNKWRNFISVVGFSLLFVGCLLIHPEKSFPGAWALIPTLAAVFLIGAGPNALINRTILSHPWLVWFGLISFPLYLWHWPLLSFVQIMEEDFPKRETRIVAVLLSVFLAWISYRWIERPIRFGKESSRTVAYLIGGLGLVGVFGLTVYLGRGLDFRLMASKRALREIVSHPEQRVSGTDCAKYLPEVRQLSFDGLCTLSKDKVPTLLVVGDSHTIQYQAAFFKYFPEESVLLLAQTSCLPFSTSKLANPECEKKIKALEKILLNHASIKTVFLAGHWAYLMSGGFREQGQNWRLPEVPTSQSIKSFSENAEGVLKAATQLDRKVTVLRDIPDLDFDIRSCFDVRPVRLTKKTIRSPCAMTTKSFEERTKPYDEVMTQVLEKFPTVHVFDPRPLFCDKENCNATDGNRPLYFNGDHLNYLGAERVIGMLKMAPMPKT